MERTARDASAESQRRRDERRDSQRRGESATENRGSVAAVHRAVGNQAVKSRVDAGSGDPRVAQNGDATSSETATGTANESDSVTVGSGDGPVGTASPGTVRRKSRREDVEVVDVRSPTAFREAHVPGATNVPVSKVGRRADRFRNASEVITYCESGRRSRRAAQELRASGLGERTHVTDLAGGIRAWRFPTESGERSGACDAGSRAPSLVSVGGRRGPVTCSTCSGRDDGATGRVARRRSSVDAGSDVDSGVERRIEAARSGGRRLPEPVRTFFEPRFDEDFSDVRIHTDPQADRAARSIGAEAFTLGRDIVFRSGNFRPHTRAGKELLAHELTHVVQQRPGAASGGPIRLGEPGDRFESEAERVATRVFDTERDVPGASHISVGKTTAQPRVQGIFSWIKCSYYLWLYNDTIDECKAEMEPYCGESGSFESCLQYMGRHDASGITEALFNCVQRKEEDALPSALASCFQGSFTAAVPTR